MGVALHARVFAVGVAVDEQDLRIRKDGGVKLEELFGMACDKAGFTFEGHDGEMLFYSTETRGIVMRLYEACCEIEANRKHALKKQASTNTH